MNAPTQAPKTSARLPRDARGKRPQIYTSPGLDETMGMIMVLASEFLVMRDRLDTIERIAQARGIDLAAEIEAFRPGQDVLETREARRQGFFAKLFYLVRKDAAEQAAKESEESFAATISGIAER